LTFKQPAACIGGRRRVADQRAPSENFLSRGKPCSSPESRSHPDHIDAGRPIFASKAGVPTNPDWYQNLKAHPDVTIEVGADTIEVVAREATGEERERLFRTQAARVPQFAEYEKLTDRVIPVIVLTPTKTG
jgi:deazaflavin-dependent oxidoreductase (nitroreductase family)